MPSKFCDVCQKIVSCNSMPNFCAWCGKDLSGEPLIEDISKFYIQKPVAASPLKSAEIEPGRVQMKLF